MTILNNGLHLYVFMDNEDGDENEGTEGVERTLSHYINTYNIYPQKVIK